jgi:hypothetical protein
VGPQKIYGEMIYVTVIMVKIGMQWDRCQIRVTGRVGGTTQIRVLEGPLYSFLICLFFSFFTPKLYSDLDNNGVSKWPNS